MTAVPSQATIRIGTRRSRLAQRQTEWVARQIEAANPGVTCHAVEFTTAGDEQLDRPIPDVGGKGAFTQELENALREDRIDLAVHSLKDLPVDDPPDLVVGAVCERADARDVLIAPEHAGWSALPRGARVGTSSMRRTAQLLAARPDLEIKPLRGNVDTRVRKATSGDYDAIVIAAAGVTRLGLTDVITEYLAFDTMLPAPGQGAIAVQGRTGDEASLKLLAPIDHTATRAAVTAERVFLQALGGGCAAPVGAFAEISEDDEPSLHLRGVVVSQDGRRVFRAELRGVAIHAARLGRLAAAQVLSAGAKEVLD